MEACLGDGRVCDEGEGLSAICARVPGHVALMAVVEHVPDRDQRNALLPRGSCPCMPCNTEKYLG